METKGILFLFWSLIGEGYMHLEQLRLFAELVNHGSFTKTADALGVSKAYLSKQIKALELELNCQLLFRNTRSMRLTTAGESINQRAQNLTSFWQETQQLVKQQEEKLEGTVRFTAPTGLMQSKLSVLVSNVNKQYPGIKLICETGNQTHNLVSEPYDFAIRITNTPPDDMVALKLMTSAYVCCASPDYIAQFGQPKTPEELNEYDCIALHYWRNWLFVNSGQHVDVAVDAKYQFSDNSLLKDAALNQLGITRLPAYLIENELAQGELVNVLPEYLGETRDVYLLYPQELNRPERVKSVLNCIKSMITR